MNEKTQCIAGPGQNRAAQTALVIFALTCVEGLGILAWVLAEPSDADGRAFLGYSLARWGLAGGVALLSGLSGAAWWFFRKGQPRAWLERLVNHSTAPQVLEVLCLCCLIALHTALHLLSMLDQTTGKAALSRLLPAAVYLALASAQALAGSVWITRRRLGGRMPGTEKDTLRLARWIWAAMLLAGGVILLTRFSLTATTNGWYEYGVPLVSEEALGLFYTALVVLSASLWAARSGWLRRIVPMRRIRTIPGRGDAALAIIIWLGAALLWTSQPIADTWMSPKPFPPNHEIYPNSDALLYDSAAQGILYGTQWARSEAHYKPIYTAFLVLLRAAGGSDYARVIFLQTLVLALFPAVLYLVGSLLHSRFAGLLIGLGIVLREYNQLRVASLVTLSSSNQLLSEMPTALGISLLLLSVAAWLKGGRREGVYAVLTGGLIGLLAQVRLQTILFLPVLLAFLFFYWNPASPSLWKRRLIHAGLILVGFAACLGPLAAHNLRITGTLALEKPGYFERTLDYSYSPAVEAAPGLPGEQTSLSPVSDGAGGFASKVGRTILLTSNHFVHNLVSTFLVLPSGYGSRAGWTGIADLERAYWLEYLAPVTLPVGFLLAANLGVVALGAAAMWRRSRGAALLPVIFFAAYALGSSLGGFSGQRFILPVDWVAAFFFLTGLAWLAKKTLDLVGWDLEANLPFWAGSRWANPGHGEQNQASEPAQAGAAVTVGVLVVMLLAGGLLPLEETIIPARGPAMSGEAARAAMEKLGDTLAPEARAAYLALLAQEDTVVLHGVALYPRAFEDEESAGGILRQAGPASYPLLSYLYEGTEQTWVLQGVREIDGLQIAHGSEVLVAGKRAEKRFEAFATGFPGEGSVIFRP